MKKELRKLLKMFFGLKSINRINIDKQLTTNEKWAKYTIEFWTINKK